MKKILLTVSGLIISLLVLIFAVSVKADGSVPWTGNGSDASACTGDHAGQTHWIFNPGGNDTVTAAELTVDGSDKGAMEENGGGSWSLYVSGGVPNSASVSYKGDLGSGDAVLTISCTGTSTSPTPTPTFTPTPTPGENNRYACEDNECVLVEGSGDNTCSSNNDCNPNSTPTPTPTSVTPTPTEPPGGGGGGGGGGNVSCGDTKPGTPGFVSQTPGPGAGQITIHWSAPDGSVTDYSIAYSDDPNTQKYGVASTGNVTSYTISDLGAGPYYFWVRAVNGCMPGDQAKSLTQAVLGLSATSGDENFALIFAQLFAALSLGAIGFRFFRNG